MNEELKETLNNLDFEGCMELYDKANTATCQYENDPKNIIFDYDNLTFDFTNEEEAAKIYSTFSTISSHLFEVYPDEMKKHIQDYDNLCG